MTVTDTTLLEAVLRRDRLVVVATLVAIIAIAWIWIVLGAGTGMNAVVMTGEVGMSHDDGTGGMDCGICRPDVRHVVGDDGGNDAAERGADTAAIRAREPCGESRESSVRANRYLRCRISGRLRRVQRARHRSAMGIGAARLALADDDDDELLAGWRNPYRRRCVAIHAGQGYLPATLPLADEFPCPGLAA
jgi:hypothetical protein